jgi:hypothetical protein
MIVQLAEQIKKNLLPMKQNQYFTHLCGMSKIVHTSYFSGKSNVLDSIPVPYNDDNTQNCRFNQSLSLIPSEKNVRAIGYFEESSPCVLINKSDNLYECNLNFICWYNSSYFSNSKADINTVLSATVLKNLNKKVSVLDSIFNFIRIESTRMISVEDSMSIFNKYTVLIDKYNLLLNPYGFFSISLNIHFSINYDCLPQLLNNTDNCIN